MDRRFALLVPLALFTAGCVAPVAELEPTPFRIDAGLDAGPGLASPFVSDYALGPSGFDARFVTVAGSRLQVDSLARVVGMASGAQTLLATLDAGGTDTRAALVDSEGVARAVLTSANPQAHFQLEPGAVLDLSLTLVTPEGAEGSASVARFRLVTSA